jgi:hypothetical protein
VFVGECYQQHTTGEGLPIVITVGGSGMVQLFFIGWHGFSSQARNESYVYELSSSPPSTVANSASLLTPAVSGAIIGRVGRMVDIVVVSFPDQQK